MKKLLTCLLAVVLLANCMKVEAANKTIITKPNVGTTGLSKSTYVIKEDKQTVGYIYLGDSRFVGMNSVVHINEDEDKFVVAKVGQGYKWMQDYAIDEMDRIMQENDFDKWVLISGLGVNDLRNIDKYISYYDSVGNMEIILLSVNPVEESGCNKYGYDYKSLSSGMIGFNSRLQETDYMYIDTYSYMMENGFKTKDGVHYTDSTYEDIYDYIQESIKEMED